MRTGILRSGARKYAVGAIIGRFRPPQLAHLEVFTKILEQSEVLAIIVGSYKCAPTIKNPFSFEETKAMILASCEAAGLDTTRIRIFPVRDYLYDETRWLSEVQKPIYSLGEENIALFGHKKDRSSYYLDSFPQWPYQELTSQHHPHLSATDVRNLYFRKGQVLAEVPEPVKAVLYALMDTDWFKRLSEEDTYYANYTAKLSGLPYPPKFLTADSLVLKSAHILLITRKSAPGKGLMALPGGFLGEETFEDAAIRELREETRLKVPEAVLRSSIKGRETFDHPQRSLRGHVVTKAHFINLGSGDLPEVRGSDDAKKAFWTPLCFLDDFEDRFFEDHFSIIRTWVA